MSPDRSTRVLDRLAELGTGAILRTYVRLGEATAIATPARIVELMELLRDDDLLMFDVLTDLTAIDHVERQPRFEVVYHLYSIACNHRLRIKVGVPEEACHVESLAGVWPAADWMEREVFDLFGIGFHNHPKLERLLLDESFEGHPLRKDFPKSGWQPIPGSGG